MASFVEFALYKNKGLGATCEPSSFHLGCWQHIIEEVVDVECSLVIWRVVLRCWIHFKLHDLRVGQSHRWVGPWGLLGRVIVGQL